MEYQHKSMIYEPEIESWKDRDFKTQYFDDFLNKYAVDGWEVLSVFTNPELIPFAKLYKYKIVIVFRKLK